MLCNRLAGLLFRFRRERESEYRKGIPPMFGKADLQEVEKYLPHLRGCSFRGEGYLWDFCKKHLKATPAEIREIARCARPVRHPFPVQK